MLTLAIYSQEGQPLAYGLTLEDARTFERSGLVVKMINEPHIELMDEGEEKC